MLAAVNLVFKTEFTNNSFAAINYCYSKFIINIKDILFHRVSIFVYVVCPVFIAFVTLDFFGLCVLLQATQQQTGFMHVQRGRNAVHIQNTKHWNWKRNFFITCI